MPAPILVAEGDADNRSLIEEALEESGAEHAIEFVKDGEELLGYLCCEGEYRDRQPDSDPGIILLDLNVPRKDGRFALEEIKRDPALSRNKSGSKNAMHTLALLGSEPSRARRVMAPAERCHGRTGGRRDFEDARFSET